MNKKYDSLTYDESGQLLEDVAPVVIHDDALVDDGEGRQVITMYTEMEYPQYAQGAAKPIILDAPAEGSEADPEAILDPVAYDRDLLGYTNPNLHRRINVPGSDRELPEVAPRNYAISVGGLNSYRTVETIYHIDYQNVTVEYLMNQYGYDRASAEALLDQISDAVKESEQYEIP